MKDKRLIDALDQLVPDEAAKRRMWKAVSGAPASPRGWPWTLATCCAAMAVVVVITIAAMPRAQLLEPETAQANDTVSLSAAAYQMESSEEMAAEDVGIEKAESSESSLMYISGCYAAPGTLEEMAERSSLILRGVVTGRSEPFETDPEGRSDTGPWEFIDYYIEPLEVFRGELREGQEISVRMSSPSEPGNPEIFKTLDTGEEYVLFLRESTFGFGIYPRGDYYLPNDTFHKQGEAYSLPDSAYSYPLETLRQKAEAFREVPFPEDFYRQERMDVARTNLENGFITQEEYEETETALDKWTVILTPAAGSADGDPRLAMARSSGVSARYVDYLPPGTAVRADSNPQAWDNEDRAGYFSQPGQKVIVGLVEDVRQIEVRPDAAPEKAFYHTVLKIRVEQSLLGDVPTETVTMLSPVTLADGSKNSSPLGHLAKGARAVLPVLENGPDEHMDLEHEDLAEAQVFYRDFAEYRVQQEAAAAVEQDGLLWRDSAFYPAENHFTSIEQITEYLQAFLP